MNMGSINYLELIDRMRFPATRAEIVEYAQNHDASEEAVEAFRALPKQYFQTLEEVSRSIGRVDQLPGDEPRRASNPQEDAY